MLNHRPLDACILLASFLFVGYYVWGAGGVCRQNLALSLPLFWAGSLVLLNAALLPAGYQYGRYLAPALLAIIICGCIGLINDLRSFDQQRALWALSRSWLGAGLVSGLVFADHIGRSVCVRDVSIVNEKW